jgi:hypothetical protein
MLSFSHREKVARQRRMRVRFRKFATISHGDDFVKKLIASSGLHRKPNPHPHPSPGGRGAFKAGG